MHPLWSSEAGLGVLAVQRELAPGLQLESRPVPLTLGCGQGRLGRVSSQPEEAALLDQSPCGLGGKQKAQSEGKRESVSS